MGKCILEAGHGGGRPGGGAAALPLHTGASPSPWAALLSSVLLSTCGQREGRSLLLPPLRPVPRLPETGRAVLSRPSQGRTSRLAGSPTDTVAFQLGPRLCLPAPPAYSGHLPAGQDKWPSVRKPLSAPPGCARLPGDQQRSEWAQPAREAGPPCCPRALMTSKLGSEQTARTWGLTRLVGRCLASLLRHF